MGKIQQADFDDVVARFYDTAYRSEDWSAPLGALTKLFDGSRAWLMSSRDGVIHGATSIDDPGFHSVEAQTVMVSDRLFELTHACQQGDVKRYSELENPAEFYGRPLFQEWLRPRDTWFGLQNHLQINDRGRVFVDISRGRNQGDFDDSHKSILALLAPHILRSGEIARIVRHSTDLHARSCPAAIVVDRQLHIVEMNNRAAVLLTSGRSPLDALTQSLQMKERQDSEQLRALVADALSGINGNGGGIMLTSPADTERHIRLVLSIAPFHRPGLFGLEFENLAVVFARQVGGIDNEILEDHLRSLFGLTPSHARLALALSGGISVRQAALERGLTYASARTYLDHIYRKTGTRQQSELVALLKTIESFVS